MLRRRFYDVSQNVINFQVKENQGKMNWRWTDWKKVKRDRKGLEAMNDDGMELRRQIEASKSTVVSDSK